MDRQAEIFSAQQAYYQTQSYTNHGQAKAEERWNANPYEVRNALVCRQTCTKNRLVFTVAMIFLMVLGLGLGTDGNFKSQAGDGAAIGFTVAGAVGCVATACMIFMHCVYPNCCNNTI